STAGLLSCASERVFVAWSRSYHPRRRPAASSYLCHVRVAFVLREASTTLSPAPSTSPHSAARHRDGNVMTTTDCAPPDDHLPGVSVFKSYGPFGEEFFKTFPPLS